MKVIDLLKYNDNEKIIRDFRNENKDEPLTLNVIEIEAFDKLSNSFLDEMNITYNEYDNGYYLSKYDNPYYILMKAKDNTKVLKIHKDCIIVKEKALENHPTIEEIIVEADEIIFDNDSVRRLTNLKKVTFLSSKKVSFNAYSFAFNYYLNTVTFNNEATYSFGYKSWICCYRLEAFLLPRKITNIGEVAFDDSNVEIAYIPENITNVRIAFNDKAYLYYEGECNEPTTRTVFYESPEDYSFNFHRGPMSYSTYTEELPKNHEGHVKYEDFLKIYKEKYNIE